jgi:hypothetical protein
MQHTNNGTYIGTTNFPLEYRLRQHNGTMGPNGPTTSVIDVNNMWTLIASIDGFSAENPLTFQQNWIQLGSQGIVGNTVKTRFNNLVSLLNSYQINDSLILYLYTLESVSEWTSLVGDKKWSFLTVSNLAPPIPDGLF